MSRANISSRIKECVQTISYWVFILLVYDIIRYAGNTVDFNEFWVTIEVVIFVGIATGIFYYIFIYICHCTELFKNSRLSV